jgi:hypothetical protein
MSSEIMTVEFRVSGPGGLRPLHCAVSSLSLAELTMTHDGRGRSRKSDAERSDRYTRKIVETSPRTIHREWGINNEGNFRIRKFLKKFSI